MKVVIPPVKINLKNKSVVHVVLPGEDWSLEATKVAGVGLRLLIWKNRKVSWWHLNHLWKNILQMFAGTTYAHYKESEAKFEVVKYQVIHHKRWQAFTHCSLMGFTISNNQNVNSVHWNVHICVTRPIRGSLTLCPQEWLYTYHCPNQHLLFLMMLVSWLVCVIHILSFSIILFEEASAGWEQCWISQCCAVKSAGPPGTTYSLLGSQLVKCVAAMEHSGLMHAHFTELLSS